MQKELEVVFRLSVTRQNEPATVCSGKAHVDHLDGAEFFQDGLRCETRGIGHRATLQCHLQTVRQKSDEDMRINAIFLRSEEHTSELQSHHDLVCRLMLE